MKLILDKSFKKYRFQKQAMKLSLPALLWVILSHAQTLQRRVSNVGLQLRYLYIIAHKRKQKLVQGKTCVCFIKEQRLFGF